MEKMTKTPRTLFIGSLAFCLVLCLVTAVTLVLTLQGKTVAVVNGEKISREKLYQAMLDQSGDEALDQMITVMLIEQEGKKRDISVSDDEVDAEITKLVDETFGGERDFFDQALEQHGIKPELFQQNIKIDLTVRKLAAAGLEFSEEELKEHFEENQTSYDQPEEIEVRHILVETEEEAREILTLLEQGADFGELARERSQDPGSAAEGGHLGFSPRGENVPAFEEVAFALEKGELSEPVETNFGYHVIELLDRKPGRAVVFAEVKEQVRADMNEARLPELIQELVASLWDNANIVYK